MLKMTFTTGARVSNAWLLVANTYADHDRSPADFNFQILVSMYGKEKLPFVQFKFLHVI